MSSSREAARRAEMMRMARASISICTTYSNRLEPSKPIAACRASSLRLPSTRNIGSNNTLASFFETHGVFAFVQTGLVGIPDDALAAEFESDLHKGILGGVLALSIRSVLGLA